MLCSRPQLAPEGLVPLIKTVIETMADGKMTIFARRYEFSKSGVSHWLNNGGQPSIKAWLTIALHGGIDMEKLFNAEVADWVMPEKPVQLTLPMAESFRSGVRSRELDWEDIRSKLRVILDRAVPISINEAADEVGVGRKHLYLQANTEARAIGDRHRRYRAGCSNQRIADLRQKIGELLEERLAEGYAGISARDVWTALDVETRSVSGIFEHIAAVLAERMY
ncbi:hypothetical protein GCM10010970_31660 [Silvimonas iriomotensis]|uniref:Uncharacterized protein n=2 Tax=Silvimonas iriomotensis TaxID=449662 RepID=A0ABQ2PCV2_9NEIS|nr:hypothetical protein GCM10010970_31660 [Silvimonas iriomotensis]